MFKISKKWLLICSFLFCSVLSVYSHPHIFMETKITVEFNRSGLKGFWTEWVFDPIFSATIIADFDTNRNGKFSEKEMKILETEGFNGLISSHFFLYLTDNNKIFKPTRVSNFSANIHDDLISYKFYTKFRSEAFKEEKMVTIGVYDSSFYCDIVFVEENPISVIESEYIDYSFTLEQNEDKTIRYNNRSQTFKKKGRKYPGSANPYELNLRFKFK